MDVAIIDDDESVSRSVARLLRHAGLSPTAFGSAEDFLASPRREGFACLVMDVHLGRGMSGIELRQRMLAESSRTPVIFLTARDDEALRARAQSVGCAAFLNKGGDLALLVAALRALASGGSAASPKVNPANSRR